MVKRTLHFGRETYLSTRHRQLYIERPGQPPTTVPIEDVGMVVLEHPQITISHHTLAALLAEGAAVITCNDRYMPNGLLLPLDGNTLQQERFEDQVKASKPLLKQLWQQTVQAKIRNQAHLLTRRGYDATKLYRWASEVKSGDSGYMEARAAATYWHNLMEDWPMFARDPDGAPPNNLFNYGYAILRATTARALVAAGLLPTLGIHHSNRYNAYCLADDVMEPYRPFVDMLVMQQVDRAHSEDDLPEILTPDHKKILLSIPVIDVPIDGNQSPLMVAMQRTCTSLMRCYSGEQRKILYPELPWSTPVNDGMPTE